MRTIVIGDIHGAYKCLVEVLELAGPADRVIFLGDYTDGLPESKEVVEHIISMPNAICIRGNHDKWTEDWLVGGEAIMQRLHYDQGGRSTFESYEKCDQAYRDRHKNFFVNTCKSHFLDEQNRLFVHGGIDAIGIATPPNIMMWDRDLLSFAYRMQMGWDRSGAPVSGKLPVPFCDFKEIYVGHTAAKFYTEKEHIANWLNLWAMDSNCGWGGPLVALDVDTKEMFTSKPARVYYPEFKGR